jgi:hypothetical protein
MEGKLDVEQRILSFHFITLDPETTDLVEDVFGGFLPPNITSPEGEGFVTFTIGLLENIQHDDVVQNQASIYFDANAAIVTNNFLNTFDLEAPSSELAIDNPVSNDTLLTVSVNGSDDGSGIRNYEIYVSENDEEFMLHSIQHSEEFLFTGEFGASYQFYSIAVDSVGNKEAEPETADAEVTIVTDVVEIDNHWPGFKVTPIPAGDYLIIEFYQPGNSRTSCTLLDLTGKEVMMLFDDQLAEGQHHLRQEIDLLPGIYLIRLQNETRQTVKKIIVE